MKYFRLFLFIVSLCGNLILIACNDSSSPDGGSSSSGNSSGSSTSAGAISSMPEILAFSSSKNCVRPGEQVDLSWEVKNGAQVYIQDNLVENSGAAPFVVSQEGNIILTVKNGIGTTQKEIPVYLREASISYSLAKEVYSFKPVQILSSSLSDDRLLLFSEGKVFRGKLSQQFTQLHPNDAVANWTALAIDPFNPSILYAATNGRVYRSTDGGNSWPGVIPVRNLGLDMDVRTVLPSASSPGIVYIGFAGGLYRANLNTNPGSLTLLMDLNGKDIQFVAEIKGKLIAATSTDFFISYDLGDHFPENPFATLPYGSLNVLRANADHLFVGTSNGFYEVDSSRPSLNLIQTFSAPIQDMRFDPSGFLSIAAQNGLYRYENGHLKKLVPDEVHWILDPFTQEVLTPQGLMQLQENVIYSEICPNQP